MLNIGEAVLAYKLVSDMLYKPNCKCGKACSDASSRHLFAFIYTTLPAIASQVAHSLSAR